MNFNDNLRLLREENNLRQEDVANVLGISRSTYKDYELRISIIPVKYLNILSNFYNVNIDFILALSERKQIINLKSEIDKAKAGLRLKEFRKENGLTQKELANYLNTTFSTIAFYEKGRNLIATPFLYTICKTYGVSADYLLGKINEPKYWK